MRRPLRRVLLARRQGFAWECGRLEEHVEVLAPFCPTMDSVVEVKALDRKAALLHPRRLTLVILIGKIPQTALELEMCSDL